MTHLKKHPSPKTKSPIQSGTSKVRQPRPAQTPNNLLVLYKVAKKLKSDKGLFKFQLSSDPLGQEMDCIIDAADIVQFVTMQEISANCIAVYMK